MRFIIFCIGIGFFYSVSAQDAYQLGLLAAINANKKLNTSWKLNLKVENRILLKEGFFQEESDFDFQYLLRDIALISTKSYARNQRLAGGYLLRKREHSFSHRLIQQYVIIQKATSFRVAHRIASDQTFAKEKNVEWRFRYRIAFEFPLSGQSVDYREFYLKWNNEYLYSVQGSNTDFEIRIVPLIGFLFTKKQKMELGLNYRVDEFFNESARHKFWLNANWFYSF